MKKICIFLAFLAFLSAFSACSSSIQNTSTVTTGDDALELIDVQKDKEDNTIVYIDSWQILNEYDAFREYFFGVWHEADSGFAEKIIIDDSEMDFLVNNHVFYFNNFYKVMIRRLLLIYKVAQIECCFGLTPMSLIICIIHR